MATFGQILKGLREGAGLTQWQVADRAGMSQRALSFWEADERDPTPANLRRLCAALGVSPREFRAAERAGVRSTPTRPRSRSDSRGGEAWTAAEDEVVRAVPAAEAARRTGRAIGPVYERRRTLRVPDGRRR